MEEQLPELRPDLALVTLYAGNDFGDLLRNKLYGPGQDGKLEEHSPTIAPAVGDYFRQARKAPLVYKLAERAWRRWRPAVNRRLGLAGDSVPEGPIERWLKERRREYADGVLDGDDEVRDLFGDTWDADIALEPGSDSAIYKTGLMDRMLGRIAAVSRGNGIPLLLVIVPAPIDACPDWGYAQVDSETYPDYRRRALTNALQSIAEKRHISRVNLFEPFYERGAALYLRGADDHWNDEGQALAAKIVADYLAGSGLLEL